MKVCAAKIFVEARFSGDPNYGMSEVVTQMVEILLITLELKPCELTRDAKFAGIYRSPSFALSYYKNKRYYVTL